MGLVYILTLLAISNSAYGSYDVIVDNGATRLLDVLRSVLQRDGVSTLINERAHLLRTPILKPCRFRNADVEEEQKEVTYIERAALPDYELIVNPTSDPDDELTSPELIDKQTALLIPILKPCRHTDMLGKQRSFNFFLERTCAGIPEYGLKAVDPLVISELVVRRNGVTFRFTNINVIGLKFRQYLKFKIDRHSYLGVTREYPVILANLAIELNCPGSIYRGTFRSSAITTTTTKSEHVIRQRCDGTEYFDIGVPFVNTKTIVQQTLMSPELEEALNDSNTRRCYPSSVFDDVAKELTSEAIQIGYDVIMQSVRNVAKILTVKSFFSDM